MGKCPRTHGIRFVQADEINGLIEQLLAQKDVMETQARMMEEQPEIDVSTPETQEDFQHGSE